MDSNKFNNLVLMICETVPNGLTTTRLNKLLWMVDKAAFLTLGHKITGCKYIRKKFGPVPVNNHDLLSNMRDNKYINFVRKLDEDEYPRVEYSSTAHANDSVFSDDEKNIISKVLNTHKNDSTGKLVRYSHDLGWALADDGEEIRFESYLPQFNLTSCQRDKMRKIIEDAEFEYEN